jgi:hypothetical protein
MSVINMNSPVPLSDCITIILNSAGDLVPLFLSEPGVGKSTLHHVLKENDIKGEYDHIYVDCPTKDIPDVGMGLPDMVSKQVQYFVSELFCKSSPKKKLIMLDEINKAPPILRTLFYRMMLEGVVGDWQLPEGSIVFATSNNASDMVGDSMLSHGINRVMLIPVKKPNADEWCNWAAEHGVSAVTRAWVAMNRTALQSYTELTPEEAEKNPFIFLPTRKGQQFVSPRSLYRTDKAVVQKRKLYSQSTLTTMLCGGIGLAAGRSMAQFLKIADEVIKVKDIIADPMGARIPEAAAIFLVMMNAIDEIKTQDELTEFLRYMARLPNEEYRALFNSMALGNHRLNRLARNNPTIKEWAMRDNNHELLID